MAINRTPVLKRCRQLGLDPIVLGYTGKSKSSSIRQPKRRRKESEYGMQLREKQKAKFVYGVLEKQFHHYYEKAERKQGITGEILLQELERRLRCRGTEDEETIQRRLKRAEAEIANSVNYDEHVVNIEVDSCAESIYSIIQFKLQHGSDE